MLPYVFVALVGSRNQALSAVGKVLSSRQGVSVGLAVGDAVGLAVGDAVGDAVGLAVGDAVGLAVGGTINLQGFWPCTYFPEPEKVPGGQSMQCPLALGTRVVVGWPELRNMSPKLLLGVVWTLHMFQTVTFLTKSLAPSNILLMSMTLETSHFPISWLKT